MSEIGLLLASYFFITTWMSVVLGRLSDVPGLRRVLIVLGLAGSAVAYWFLGVTKTFFQLILLWGFLVGVADAAQKPSSVAAIAEIAPPQIVGRSIGVYNAFLAAGMALGTLIGGKVADLMGLPFVFTAASVILVVGTASSLVVVKLGTRARGGDSGVTKPKKQISHLFDAKFLLGSGMALLCIDLFLRNCGFRGAAAFLPVYLAQLGADNTLIGLVASTNFFAQMFFMPLMGWISDKIGRKRVLSLGMFATVLSSILLSIVGNPLEVIAIQVMVGFSWASITVASNAFAADIAPPERLGMMMGLIPMSTNLGAVVGLVAAGFISERFDLRITFAALALFPLLSLLLSLKLSGRSSKQLNSRN